MTVIESRLLKFPLFSWPVTFCLMFTFFAALAAAGNAADLQVRQNKNYTLTITPYAWLMDLKGTAGAHGYSVDVDAPFTATSKQLNFAAMTAVDALYKNKIGITANLNLAMLGGHEAVKGVSLSSKSSMLMSDAAVLYRVASIPLNTCKKRSVDIDLLAGIRIWRAGLKIDVSSSGGNREYSQHETWVDPIVGARIILNLNEKWSLRFRGGYGGFSTSSKKTWDASALAGYKINSRTSIVAGYRAVGVNYRKNSDQFIFDIALRGPIIGAIFNF